MYSVLYYLVLVRGVKFIPRLRVIGLVPAKHMNRNELGICYLNILYLS